MSNAIAGFNSMQTVLSGFPTKRELIDLYIGKSLEVSSVLACPSNSRNNLFEPHNLPTKPCEKGFSTRYQRLSVKFGARYNRKIVLEISNKISHVSSILCIPYLFSFLSSYNNHKRTIFKTIVLVNECVFVCIVCMQCTG